MAEIQFGAASLPGDAEGRLVDVPAARYTDQELLAAERDHLWPRVWLLAGFAFDVAKPGDHFVFELGRDSILVTHDQEGQVRAFHNVCMHRGHILRDPGRGSCKTFVCPYHRWEWGLDGKLCHVPLGAAFEAGIPEDRRRLPPVACRVLQGLVWIHLGEPQESLEEYLGPIADQLARYDLARFSINQDVTLHWDTNWKTAIDGFNETYHVTSVHPQYSDSIYAANARWQFTDRHSLFMIKLGDRPPSPDAHQLREPLSGWVKEAGRDPAELSGRIDEARAVVQRRMRERAAASGQDLSRLSDEQLIDTHEFYVFPNVQIDFHTANDLTIHRYRPDPDNPGKCLFDVIDLARRGSSNDKARPQHQHVGMSDEKMGIVYRQDILRLARVQRGMRTGRFPGPLASRMERRLVHMHLVLDKYLSEFVAPALRVSTSIPERVAASAEAQ